MQYWSDRAAVLRAPPPGASSRRRICATVPSADMAFRQPDVALGTEFDVGLIAASIARVAVSRAGHFSCPLRTGLLLLGEWRSALGAAADGSIRADEQTLLTRMQVSTCSLVALIPALLWRFAVIARPVSPSNFRMLPLF